MIKLLVIDDSVEKQKLIVDVCLRTGLLQKESIYIAADAEAGKILLGTITFDVALIDLQMPTTLGGELQDDAGSELLAELFERDDLKMPLQIIGLTAHDHLVSERTSEFESRGVLLIKFDPSLTSWEASIASRIRQAMATHIAQKSAVRGYEIDLGIICALDFPELEAVRNLPWNWTEFRRDGDPTVYYRGHYVRGGRQRDVVAAACPRMGMSAAAVTATKLIESFRPKYLAMTGITGAVRGKARIGDVIAADPSWDWGCGKWEKGDDGKPIFRIAPHQIAMAPLVRSAIGRLAKDKQTLNRLRESVEGSRPPANTLTLHLAPAASGSSVVSEESMTQSIAAQHRKLAGIEMEIYGIYAAAAEATFPAPLAFAFKSVSDFADSVKQDRWQQFCSHMSAATLRCFMEEFVD